MTRPVLDESDQFARAPAVGSRTTWKPRGERLVRRETTIDLVAKQTNQIRIRHFGAAADIVGFAETSAQQDERYSGAVIFHKQPVANIAAIAVNRQFLPGNRIDDHQWNEFFRKLIGTVIVGAVRNRYRQTMRMRIG